MLAAAVGPASYVHHSPLFLSLAAFPSLSVYHVRVCRAQRGNAAGSGGGVFAALLPSSRRSGATRSRGCRTFVVWTVSDSSVVCCFRPFILLAPSTPKPCHNIIHPPPSSPPPTQSNPIQPNPTQPALILLTGHSTTTLPLSLSRARAPLVHAELRRKSAPPPASPARQSTLWYLPPSLVLLHVVTVLHRTLDSRSVCSTVQYSR